MSRPPLIVRATVPTVALAMAACVSTPPQTKTPSHGQVSVTKVSPKAFTPASPTPRPSADSQNGGPSSSAAPTTAASFFFSPSPFQNLPATPTPIPIGTPPPSSSNPSVNPTPTPTTGASAGNTAPSAVPTGGQVSLVAGSSMGSANGQGASAQFNMPMGVVVGSDGTIYVADTGNDCIRKIDSSNNVTTFAGQPGQAGSANGQSSSAQFHSPTGLAMDSSGNIYVADSGNDDIRKIDSSGNVTTLAGAGQAGMKDGTGTAAMFHTPYGIVFDGQGNLYVSDAGNNQIRMVAIANGQVSTFAGDPAGTATFADGDGTQGATTGGAAFNHPEGLAIDTTSTIYIADTGNNRIRRMTTPGAVVDTIWGNGSTALIDAPGGVAVTSNAIVYATDSAANRIRGILPDTAPFDPNHTALLWTGTTAGSTDGAFGTAEMSDPEGLAIDPADGSLIVADAGNHRIRKVFPQ